MQPIDFNGLDTAVHGPVRLGVLTALQTDGPLDFTTLKKRLEVADGAMGIHLRKLEDIRYIACSDRTRGCINNKQNYHGTFSRCRKMGWEAL